MNLKTAYIRKAAQLVSSCEKRKRRAYSCKNRFWIGVFRKQFCNDIMTLATPRDKALVIAIFQQAFKNNPHIKFLMGTKNLDHKIAIMTSYVFDIAVARQGVYLSKDRMGALIAFDFDQLPLNPREKLAQIRMALRCFSWWRLGKISRTESLIQANRRAEAKDIYVWFYGVSDAVLGQKTARELLKGLFEMAEQRNAGIIAETSIARNQVIYKRYGFECYAQIQCEGFPVFYMRRLSPEQD